MSGAAVRTKPQALGCYMCGEVWCDQTMKVFRKSRPNVSHFSTQGSKPFITSRLKFENP